MVYSPTRPEAAARPPGPPLPLGLRSGRMVCQPAMNSRSPLFLAALAAAASSLPACGSSTPSGSCVLAVGDSPVQGPGDAWVTIVEFADFQCPYCKIVVPTLAELETEYPNDMRLVWKNFPLTFHDRSLAAAKAALCAHEQGKFWQMHDLLYGTDQSDDAFSDANLASDAAYLGLDTVAFAACTASADTGVRIQADLALGQSSYVGGTPTFFINGKRLEGAQPVGDFRDAIDSARAAAQSSGIARADYYTSLEAGGCNLTPP